MKKYTSNTRSITALPRSKRLRQAGVSATAVQSAAYESGDWLPRSVWDSVFTVADDGTLRVRTDLLVTGGVTVYADGTAEGGSGSGGVIVVDGLESTMTDAALSANMGRVLKELIDSKSTVTTWAQLEGKPTTIAGFGITDAYTKTQTASLLAGYLTTEAAAATYVTLGTEQTLTGAKTFSALATFGAGATVSADQTLTVGGVTLSRHSDGTLFVDGNIVVSGGVTIYGDGGASGGSGGASGGSGGGVIVVDGLTSTDTSAALSANQGRILKGMIDGKSDSGHTHSWDAITGKPTTFAPASHTHPYLPLSGGTMTGVLSLLADQYTDGYNGALNCNNSDIYGLNSIYTADLSDTQFEGIHFYRTDSTVDTFRIKNGVMYFAPNRTLGGTAAEYTVMHSGNYRDYALPLTGGTMTGSIVLKGNTSNDMTYDGNVHPKIDFHNPDSSQKVAFVFTDYDTYRWPAGIKLVGNQGSEWFEAPHIYATELHAKTLRGNSTGLLSRAGVYTKENRLTSANIDATSDTYNTMQYFIATSSMTTGKPKQDGYILHLNWDQGYWNCQLAVNGFNEDTYIAVRSQTGSASSWSSWIYAALMDVSNSGNFSVTGGITMYSDLRKKTLIEDVELRLDEIADAPLLSHVYKDDDKRTLHVGSSAQYWEALRPGWFTREDSDGYYMMEIQNCALAAAISLGREVLRYESKTDKQIRKLKRRIAELEEQIEEIKNTNQQNNA